MDSLSYLQTRCHHMPVIQKQALQQEQPQKTSTCTNQSNRLSGQNMTKDLSGFSRYISFCMRPILLLRILIFIQKKRKERKKERKKEGKKEERELLKIPLVNPSFNVKNLIFESFWTPSSLVLGYWNYILQSIWNPMKGTCNTTDY